MFGGILEDMGSNPVYRFEIVSLRPSPNAHSSECVDWDSALEFFQITKVQHKFER